MSNPFAGIITSQMKTLWKNMIDALLEDDALTLACRPIYEGGSVTDISGGNDVDPIGNKPPAVFLHGGPQFRQDGNDVADTATDGDTIYLAVIWDSRKWVKTNSANALINAPDVHVQTLSKLDSLLTIKRASKLVIDEDLESTVRHVFQRVSEPEPIGFGQSNHFLTMWKKIGS
jgi:hypothetical protein